MAAKFNDAFWEWFGNSKVIDKQTRPLIVYHGTPTPGFSSFKRQTGGWSGGFGFWFGSSVGIAKEFARKRFADKEPGIIECYLSIQNPKAFYGWTDFVEACRKTKKYDMGDMQKSLRNSLVRKGYDGAVIFDSDTDRGGVRDDWIAFYPEQIKAVDNDGTWDADDPDIRSNPRRRR